MPTALPAGFGDASKSGESSGFVEMRGIFDATIYNIERQSKERQGVMEHNFLITFRIDGGEFDGEDTSKVFVGLFSRAIFTLHDILVALEELDTYYKKNEDGKGGQWVALPDEADLQGKRLRIQIDNAPWQSTQREDRDMGVVNPDGTPVLRDGNGITAYYSIKKPAPEYRPRTVKPRLAKKQPTAVPQMAGGFPGQVGGDDAWSAGGAGADEAGTQPW